MRSEGLRKPVNVGGCWAKLVLTMYPVPGARRVEVLWTPIKINLLLYVSSG